MRNEIIVVENIKIKRKTILDLTRFYKFVRYWMDDNGFFKELPAGAFKETKYVEKTEPGGKHLEIFWEGEKNFSDYFTHKLTVSYLILGWNKVEIQQGNKKLKLDDVDIEIRISGILVTDTDPKNFFKDTPFSKFIQKIYETLIVKKRLEKYKIEVYNKTYALQDEIKKFMDMYRF